MDTPLISQRHRRPTVWQSLGTHVSSLRPRFSRPVLILLFVVASLAFFSAKKVGVHPLFYNGEPNLFRSIHSQTDYFGSPGRWYTNRATTWLNVKLQPTSSYIAKPSGTGLSARLSSRSRQDFIAPSTDGSCHIDDVLVDKEIGTRDCSVGRYCRARIIVSTEEGVVTIRAGYNIFGKNGVIAIDKRTKGRVGAVTRTEATRWAKRLLHMVREDLKELKCHVTPSMIADAIMNTKDGAASCPRTDSPLCTPLVTVKTCTVAVAPYETEEQRACQNFLESAFTNVTLDSLSAASPCAKNVLKWDSSCLSISVPFCSTVCPESPCPDQKHTMFAPLSVCGSGSGSQTASDVADGMASIFAPLYETVIGQALPPCEFLLYHPDMIQAGIIPVASSSKTNPAPINVAHLPRKLLGLFERYGVQLTYMFFSLGPAPFEVYLDKSCHGAPPPFILIPHTPEPETTACQEAYDHCDFYFANEKDVPLFSVDGPDNMAFSPVIESRNMNERLGVLNSNDLTIEVIENDGSIAGITSLPAAQAFSRTQFKPFTVSNTRASGIGHETFQADQREVVRNRCVRVFFSHYQLLQLAPPHNVKDNVVAGKADNKCVVFRTS